MESSLETSLKKSSAQFGIKRQEFVERFLEQELLQINYSIITKSCDKFNKYNRYCRCCRFYSVRVQQRKFGGHFCRYWPAVFGLPLKKFIEDHLYEPIQFTPKFISLWKNRKIKPVEPVSSIDPGTYRVVGSQSRLESLVGLLDDTV